MSNDFSNDDGVDEGICLESNSAAERISKAGSEKVCLKNKCCTGSYWNRVHFLHSSKCVVLCFGFVTRTVLIAHQCVNSC